MAKLLWLLVLLAIAWRMVIGRWPWEPLRRKGRSAEEEHALALLGLSGAVTETEILEAHRRLVARVHPDRGGTADQVHEANAARDLLLSRAREGQSLRRDKE